MTDISSISAAADPSMLAGNMATSSASSLSLKMGAVMSADKIDKTAQDFEAMFATQMLQPMFEGISADPTFGGGHGEEIMRSFLLQEYGKIIAKTDKLGVAPQVKSEMLRMQEGASGTGQKRSPVHAKNAYQSAANTTSGSDHVAVQ